jgi:hypothetical protein
VGFWQGWLTVSQRRREHRGHRDDPRAISAQPAGDNQAAQSAGINDRRDLMKRPVEIDREAPVVAAEMAGASISAPLGRSPRRVRGRESLLRILSQHLNQGGLVVLAGPGGVGKSTVAIELVRQARDRGGYAGAEWQIWWVSGANSSSLIAGLVSVARRVGAAEADLQAISAQASDGPDRLWHFLEQVSGRWLLVIDNADDPELLAAPPLPSTEGKRTPTPKVAEGTGWVRSTRGGLTLITSRQRAQTVWGTDASVLQVGTLMDVEAGEVLLDLAPEAGTKDQAEGLGRRLGGLPLALHLAGSYLDSEFARWTSFDAYREAHPPASSMMVGGEDHGPLRRAASATARSASPAAQRHPFRQHPPDARRSGRVRGLGHALQRSRLAGPDDVRLHRGVPGRHGRRPHGAQTPTDQARHGEQHRRRGGYRLRSIPVVGAAAGEPDASGSHAYHLACAKASRWWLQCRAASPRRP